MFDIIDWANFWLCFFMFIFPETWIMFGIMILSVVGRYTELFTISGCEPGWHIIKTLSKHWRNTITIACLVWQHLSCSFNYSRWKRVGTLHMQISAESEWGKCRWILACYGSQIFLNFSHLILKMYNFEKAYNIFRCNSTYW